MQAMLTGAEAVAWKNLDMVMVVEKKETLSGRSIVSGIGQSVWLCYDLKHSF